MHFFKFGINLILLTCVACTGVHMENAKLLKHEEWHNVDLPEKFQDHKNNGQISA